MLFVPVISVLLLIALDQASKRVAFDYLRPLGSVPLLDGFMDLCYVENKGAAFGLFQGGRWFFVALTCLVVTMLALNYAKLPKQKPYNWVRVSMALICAGAMGNCLDRLLFVYVIDFIRVTFIDFPVFNFADIFVVTGTILLAFIMIFIIKEQPPKEAVPENATDSSA